MRRILKEALRAMTVLAALGAALPLQAEPEVGKGGCCRLKAGGTAEKNCRTSTETMCSDLAQSVGKCYIWFGEQRCEGTQCVNGVSNFTCQGGDNNGKPCESKKDCPGEGAFCDSPEVNLIEALSKELLDEPECVVDFDPPVCVLAASRSGPPAQIDIKAQDTGFGLQRIDILLAENADVEIPLFEVTSKEPAIVTATKQDPLERSRVELRVVDVAGNVTLCDPILTQVIRGTGKPVSESYSRLSEAEDTVTLDNGSPGLRALEIEVNGTRFRAVSLEDGETRTVDVSSAMLQGSFNVITLTSHGKPGGSAAILIWDGEGE